MRLPRSPRSSRGLRRRRTERLSCRALAVLSAVSVLATSAFVVAAGAVPAGAAAGSAGAAAPHAAVSNLDQTEGFAQSFNWDQAQAFTTGPDPDGYLLAAVRIGIDTDAGTAPSYRVTVREADADGAPSSSVLGTLDNPASPTGDVWEFTAPPGGIALAADSTYFVVIDVRAAASTHQAWLAGNTRAVQVTDSDEIDPGADDGWSVAPDAMVRLAWTTRDWEPRDPARQIAIEAYPAAEVARLVALAASGGGTLMMELTGHAVTADAAAGDTHRSRDTPTADAQQQSPPPPNAVVEDIPPQPEPAPRTAAQQQAPGSSPTAPTDTPTTLVSNAGLTDNFDHGWTAPDLAQPFTTGSVGDDQFGFLLTSVELSMRDAQDSTSTVRDFPTVSVWTVDNDPQSPRRGPAYIWLDDKVGDLQQSGPPPDGSSSTMFDVEFVAAGDGIHLDADTTYIIVIDYERARSNYRMRVAPSGDETAAAPGWSLADVSGSRTATRGTGHEGYKRFSEVAYVTQTGAIQGAFQTLILSLVGVARTFGYLHEYGPHVAQVGQTHPGGCGGNRMPGLTPDELYAHRTWFCDTARDQWVPGQWPVAGIDYAREDQMLRRGDEDFPEDDCLYTNARYDPITRKCYLYGPAPDDG